MTGNVPGDLIYPFDAAAGEALGRRESHTPKIGAPAQVKPDGRNNMQQITGSKKYPNGVQVFWTDAGNDRNDFFSFEDLID